MRKIKQNFTFILFFFNVLKISTFFCENQKQNILGNWNPFIRDWSWILDPSQQLKFTKVVDAYCECCTEVKIAFELIYAYIILVPRETRFYAGFNCFFLCCYLTKLGSCLNIFRSILILRNLDEGAYSTILY